MNTQTASMRYKGYTLHHNPSDLKITTANKVQTSTLPFNCEIAQDICKSPRVITGNGVIYGEDCFDRLQNLKNLQRKGGSGVLSLPFFESLNAFFTSLTVNDEPSDNLVQYTFVFTEDFATVQEKNMADRRFCIVGKGETLWDISYKYAIAVETLLENNKWIQCCDYIKEGDKVVLF